MCARRLRQVNAGERVRAKEWHKANGLGGRRSSTRLAVQEIEEAARLVRANAEELASRGEFSSIMSWFDALNKDILVTVTFIKNPGG